jgi:hypothetical protein
VLLLLIVLNCPVGVIENVYAVEPISLVYETETLLSAWWAKSRIEYPLEPINKVRRTREHHQKEYHPT